MLELKQQMFIKLVINIIFILLVHITNAQKVEILMPNVTTNKVRKIEIQDLFLKKNLI